MVMALELERLRNAIKMKEKAGYLDIVWI